MTKQRQVVYDIIFNSMKHLSADEIFGLARKQIPNISVGTVYRNLGILVDEKIIRKISTKDGMVYDKSLKPHGHIICPCCGDIVDYYTDFITEKLNKDFGDKLKSYELIVNALCQKCVLNEED